MIVKRLFWARVGVMWKLLPQLQTNVVPEPKELFLSAIKLATA